MNRRKFIYGAASMAAMTTLPRYSLASDAQELKIWGPPAIPSIVLGALESKQQGSKHPINFELYKGSEMLRAGLASNSMPLLLMPTYVAANFYNKGKDLMLLDLISNGFFYIVSRNKKIKNVDDLEGKKVAIFHNKNTMPDIVLRVLLRAAKIEDKVELIYFKSSSETMAMFMKKKFDITLISEPQASVILNKAKKTGDNVFLSIDIQKEWGRLLNSEPLIPMVSLVADRQYYENNHDILQELRSNLSNSVEWMVKNPNKGADFGKKIWPNIPQRVLVDAIPRANLTFSSSEKSEDIIKFYYSKLLELNPHVVGGKIPNDGFFGH